MENNAFPAASEHSAHQCRIMAERGWLFVTCEWEYHLIGELYLLLIHTYHHHYHHITKI